MTSKAFIPTADELWQASLAIYQEAGMQEALLKAQDTDGDNVNLALLHTYLQRMHAPLSAFEHAELKVAVRAFNTSHTKPLRQLRRQLAHSDLLPQKSREQLKQQLLAAELTLEKQEQAILLKQLQLLRQLP